MQTVLAAASLAASVLGLAWSNLRTCEDRRAGEPAGIGPPRSLLVWYVALVIAGFAATLPTRPPFHPGLAFGWGFLIGGALGVYAALEAARSWRSSVRLTRAVGLISAASAGPALILLVFPRSPHDTLAGYALGAVLLALVWRLCLSPLGVRGATDEAERQARGADLFALVAVGTAVAVRLGVEHFEGGIAGVDGALRALPVLVASLSGLALELVPSLASGERQAMHYGLVTAAIPVAFALVLSWQVTARWDAALVVLAGAAGMGLMAWLATAAGGEKQEAERPVVAAFGVAFVALALVAVGFRLLHGYGESLALVGGIAPAMCVMAASDRHSAAAPLASGGFALILLLAIHRLLLERAPEQQPLQWQQHYDYFALALGVLAGLGVLAWALESRRAAAEAADETEALQRLMARAPGPLLAVVLVPMAVLLVWSTDAVGGLLVGLAVAELAWLMLVAWGRHEDRELAAAAAPHAVLVAAALVAAQLTPLIADVADLTRAWKAAIAIGVAVAAGLWAVLSAARAQRRGAGEVGTDA
ncbi:MAG: hypothetical protein AB7Y46_12250 [Armatimonadota bacterium]